MNELMNEPNRKHRRHFFKKRLRFKWELRDHFLCHLMSTYCVHTGGPWAPIIPLISWKL